MPKTAPQPDVLVLGDHPAAYFTAALLAAGDGGGGGKSTSSKLHVLHATIPGDTDADHDRLALINPEFFKLDESLEPLRRSLAMTPVYGVQFLADQSGTHSEHRAGTKAAPVAFVVSCREVREAMKAVAHSAGVNSVAPRSLDFSALDERGVEFALDGAPVRAKVVVVGGQLNDAHQRMLSVPDSWGKDVVHRYTYVDLPKAESAMDCGTPRSVVPMSLDLRGMLCWAWALPHGGRAQLAVEQPVETLSLMRPLDLLKHWIAVLIKHGVLRVGEVSLDDAKSIDLPFAGALAHEGVANRTLLVGPAGGFYSATGEDLYPNCWSALFAAEVIRKALKEPHLQDALQPYRQKWRTTLGDYLRGPQQNLRFLLPLVYRNQVMTTRLAEAILLGKSVVR